MPRGVVQNQGIARGTDGSGVAASAGRFFSDAALAPAARPASDVKRYDDLIDEGHRLLDDRKPLEAYASAAEAAALDSSRFEAYALESLVMRQQGDLPKASELVEKALSRAPDAKKPALHKLRDLLAVAQTTAGEFAAHFDAAKRAALDHKFAKAAREYETAWKIKPDDPAAGYQSAVAYAATEDYAHAVPIARAVAASANPEAATKAKTLLEKLKPVLGPRVGAKVATAEGLLADRKAEDAEPIIRGAIALDPQPAYTTFLLARALAGQEKTDAALDAAEQAVALGMTDKATWMSAPELASLAGEKRFTDLIADTFGGSATVGLADKLRAAVPPRAGPIANSIGMKFVSIRPGEFIMGSPANEEGRSDNETQHKVTLTKAFYMQTTPVTQAQWRAVMGTDPSHFKGDNLPVEQVSWNDARDFCRRLSEKEQKKYRLPTEAEWEYACRAGTTTRFNTGDGVQALDEAGWYHDNSGEDVGNDHLVGTRQTHPVGTKAPNKWGLYDMHGNVWQWCSDYYGPYGDNATDPTGSEQGDANSSRVMRGGSWFDFPRLCRCAIRVRGAPGFRYGRLGFRVCLDNE